MICCVYNIWLCNITVMFPFTEECLLLKWALLMRNLLLQFQQSQTTQRLDFLEKREIQSILQITCLFERLPSFLRKYSLVATTFAFVAICYSSLSLDTATCHCYLSFVTCHLSFVTCHLSLVISHCYLLFVTCYLSLVIYDCRILISHVIITCLCNRLL